MNEHQTRPDLARLEKELDSDPSSRPTSIHHVADANSQASATNGRIFLSQEQALERARRCQDEDVPIYLAYATHDKDNPRNWPRWKKWYITCFVSILNILT